MQNFQNVTALRVSGPLQGRHPLQEILNPPLHADTNTYLHITGFRKQAPHWKRCKNTAIRF